MWWKIFNIFCHFQTENFICYPLENCWLIILITTIDFHRIDVVQCIDWLDKLLPVHRQKLELQVSDFVNFLQSTPCRSFNRNSLLKKVDIIKLTHRSFAVCQTWKISITFQFAHTHTPINGWIKKRTSVKINWTVDFQFVYLFVVLFFFLYLTDFISFFTHFICSLLFFSAKLFSNLFLTSPMMNR